MGGRPSSWCNFSSICFSRAVVSTGLAPPKMDELVCWGAGSAGFSVTVFGFRLSLGRSRGGSMMENLIVQVIIVENNNNTEQY